MKVTIEIPDDTLCGFVNYVYGSLYGLTLGTTSIDTEMLKLGEFAVKGTDGYNKLKEN